VLAARDRHGRAAQARLDEPRRARAPEWLIGWISASPAGVALVCAASKGLGRGCAQALADAGCEVTIVARNADLLRRTAEEIGARAGRPVAFVAAQTSRRPEGRERRARRRVREPDILSTMPEDRRPATSATGTGDAWLRAIDANMLTPIELIKATVDTMIARKFGRIVNITSSAVKAPIDDPRAFERRALRPHRLRRRLARKVAVHNVTINNLLPGSFDTDRLRATIEARAKARASRSSERCKAGRAATPGGALRHDRGVRRDVRVPLQRARRLHRRPERPDRRRAAIPARSDGNLPQIR
jgi:3-oxoacyl-[acyl-carrier protein] reductase